MKGLVCDYKESKWEEAPKGVATCVPTMRETIRLKPVLCISDCHDYGVTVCDENGNVFTVKPDDLIITPPDRIPPKFDDWRVQMGFDGWNYRG